MKKVYENTFVQGRELTKKLMIAIVVCCVLILITYNSGVDNYIHVLVSIAAVILFGITIYVIVKFCRCPHCGKVIFMGLLKIQKCPSCHRNLVTGKKK